MIRFGTGGWRGVIADDFTFENVRRVAKGMALYAKEQAQGGTLKPIIVAYDMRFLSPSFAETFAEVLASNRVDVLFMKDPSPTPMVMHAVEREGLDFGITITASHNPQHYNGVKVIVAEGRDAPVEVTDALEQLINALPPEPIEHGTFAQHVAEQRIRMYTGRNAYIDSLLGHIDVEAIQQRPFHILFNPMFGTSRDIMMVCLASLRCNVEMINFQPDLVNTRRIPTPERSSLRDMEWMVKDKSYDLGIATDGDSDRIGLYDDTGAYVEADHILRLLYYYLKEYRGEKGGVVRNITTTHILDRIAKAYNEPAYEVPVGFKYISAAMDQYDLLLGGESSGGVKLRGHVNGKDGIFAALVCVEMIAKTGKTLSQLGDEIATRFGRTETHAINLPITPAEKLRLQSLLFQEKYVPSVPKATEKVSYQDGVKLYFPDDTWCCIRFSGTEPLVRIFMEQNDAHEIQDIVGALAEDKRLGLPISQ